MFQEICCFLQANPYCDGNALPGMDTKFGYDQLEIFFPFLAQHLCSTLKLCVCGCVCLSTSNEADAFLGYQTKGKGNSLILPAIHNMDDKAYLEQPNSKSGYFDSDKYILHEEYRPLIKINKCKTKSFRILK